jgi:hypothetical protein
MTQPVFHVYDIGYLLHIYPFGTISTIAPKNKWVDPNITSYTFNNLSTTQLDIFTNFIRKHYLQNGENKYIPSRENITSYFYGNETRSIFTILNRNANLQSNKCHSQIMVPYKKTLSVITSRQAQVHIDGFNSNKEPNSFPIQYVDYLCVDKGRRKKGIAPRMIQTHFYNQCRMWEKEPTNICLFKREGQLTGIVPLTVYSSYGFSTKLWNKPPVPFQSLAIIQITPTNIRSLCEFIQKQQAQFKITIQMPLETLTQLIKTDNIFVYGVINPTHNNTELYHAYFFRKSCTFIKDKTEIVECFASIKGNYDTDYQIQTNDNNHNHNDNFIIGFKLAFWNLSKKHNFSFLDIENISHNDVIVNNLIYKHSAEIISPTAYFFYNFAYPTFNSKKVLIII